MKDVRIELNSPTSGRVFIDGMEVTGVTGFALRARAGGNVHTLTLELMPKSVEVTGLADVTERHVLLSSKDG